MGGWLALELARRGRARTVCALSPAGAWDATSEDIGARARRCGEPRRRPRARPWMPLLMRSRAARRFALRLNVVHGDRVTSQELIALADDLLGCEVIDDLLDTDEQLAPLDPPPCPITIAWSRRDRVLPLDRNGARARELVPGARFLVLEDVGHAPMLDDPGIVAATILATTGAAVSSADRLGRPAVSCPSLRAARSSPLQESWREGHHHVVAVPFQEARRPACAAQVPGNAALHEQALAGGGGAFLEELLYPWAGKDETAQVCLPVARLKRVLGSGPDDHVAVLRAINRLCPRAESGPSVDDRPALLLLGWKCAGSAPPGSIQVSTIMLSPSGRKV